MSLCYYVDCPYGECCYSDYFRVFMPSVIMLEVILLNVAVPSVILLRVIGPSVIIQSTVTPL